MNDPNRQMMTSAPGAAAVAEVDGAFRPAAQATFMLAPAGNCGSRMWNGATPGLGQCPLRTAANIDAGDWVGEAWLRLMPTTGVTSATKARTMNFFIGPPRDREQMKELGFHLGEEHPAGGRGRYGAGQPSAREVVTA